MRNHLQMSKAHFFTKISQVYWKSQQLKKSKYS